MFISWDCIGNTYCIDHMLELQWLGTALGAIERVRCDYYYSTLSGLCEALM